MTRSRIYHHEQRVGGRSTIAQAQNPQEAGPAPDTVSGAAVVASVPVGAYPEGVAVTPDGRHAYVTNNDSNDVTVIEISDRDHDVHVGALGILPAATSNVALRVE